MTKKDLWSVFVKKNPNFATTGASLSAKGLKKFFDTVYDQGHDQGFKNGKAYQEMHGKKKERKTDFMEKMFGF